MSPVVETILFVFGLVALGYLAGLTGYLKAEVGDALTQFAVGVALPLLLFRTMVGADFHGSAPWALWSVYFAAAAVTWIVGHLVMTRAFDASRHLVFEALTRPELIKRWLAGPDGWTMVACTVDLRVGGRYRYEWRHDTRA